MSTRRLTRSALIAGLYVLLAAPFTTLVSGPLQFRISEILTLTPIFMVEGIWGVTVGCLITNILFGKGIADIIIGTLTTLVAALLTYRLRKSYYLAAIPPIILNALTVPIILIIAKTYPWEAYLLNVLIICATQAIVILGIGLPMSYILKNRYPKFVKMLNSK